MYLLSQFLNPLEGKVYADFLRVDEVVGEYDFAIHGEHYTGVLVALYGLRVGEGLGKDIVFHVTFS